MSRLVSGSKAGKAAKLKPVVHHRSFPIGAEVMPNGGVHFRVWAPQSERVHVELSEQMKFRKNDVETVELEREDQGYFSGFVSAARPGIFYTFRLAKGSYPDPASRFQPDGPHGPSQI